MILYEIYTNTWMNYNNINIQYLHKYMKIFIFLCFVYNFINIYLTLFYSFIYWGRSISQNFISESFISENLHKKFHFAKFHFGRVSFRKIFNK